MHILTIYTIWDILSHLAAKQINWNLHAVTIISLQTIPHLKEAMNRLLEMHHHLNFIEVLFSLKKIRNKIETLEDHNILKRAHHHYQRKKYNFVVLKFRLGDSLFGFKSQRLLRVYGANFKPREIH